jgi:hypothetical protein
MRPRELLTLAFAPFGGSLAFGSAVLLGPWSPLALDPATARLAAGDTTGAIRAYEAAGAGWHLPDVRADAWARAARLRLAAGDARGAVRALEHAVEVEPVAAERAALLGQLAALYEGPLADPRACAAANEQAAAEVAGTPGAAAWEADAARCWDRVGDTPAAMAARERAGVSE